MTDLERVQEAKQVVLDSIHVLVRAELAANGPGAWNRVQKLAATASNVQQWYATRAGDVDEVPEEEGFICGPAEMGMGMGALIENPRRNRRLLGGGPDVNGDMMRELIPMLSGQVGALDAQAREREIRELELLCDARTHAEDGADTASIDKRIAELETKLDLKLPPRKRYPAPTPVAPALNPGPEEFNS